MFSLLKQKHKEHLIKECQIRVPLAFAMSVNKARGQTLRKTDLYFLETFLIPGCVLYLSESENMVTYKWTRKKIKGTWKVINEFLRRNTVIKCEEVYKSCLVADLRAVRGNILITKHTRQHLTQKCILSQGVFVWELVRCSCAHAITQQRYCYTFVSASSVRWRLRKGKRSARSGWLNWGLIALGQMAFRQTCHRNQPTDETINTAVDRKLLNTYVHYAPSHAAQSSSWDSVPGKCIYCTQQCTKFCINGHIFTRGRCSACNKFWKTKYHALILLPMFCMD
jgi:hypothetical protein